LTLDSFLKGFIVSASWDVNVLCVDIYAGKM